MLSLNSPIESVPRINKRIVPSLKNLGIRTIRDLLFHLPSRYEDFSNAKLIRNISAQETVTLRGKITKISNRRTAKKRMMLTEIVIEDSTGSIKALWFNQPFLSRNFREGMSVNLSGKVVLGPYGLYLQNPAHERIAEDSADDEAAGIHTGGLVAIYPESRGVSSRWLRYLLKNLIGLITKSPDPLPVETKKRNQLLDLNDAVSAIHFPHSLEEADNARHRFVFEKLLLIQIRALRERLELKRQQAPEIPMNVALMKEFVRSLPFELTNAQRRSIWEIIQDISKPVPMNRLLQGDVGSGKTVVAAAASLLAVHRGWRVAFMAPTEVLAKQHHETLQKILNSFQVEVGILTGAEKRIENMPSVVVGTHALIQKNVTFDNLGLVIIDEQHRFGVEQRAALLKNRSGERDVVTKQLVPHFLSMSATPIPRTLTLTVYGDLDLSILDEQPATRKTIITKIIDTHMRESAYQMIRDEIANGRQVFVICPRIELKDEREMSKAQQRFLQEDVKAVKEEYKKLSESVFPEFKVAMLHGKLKSSEKQNIMKKFKDREFDILVSTSVIEVGIDVPNATVIMIEGAEKFGLAQLHQFRGRVGRGEHQSYCFLFPSADGPVSRRLRAVVDAKNGFELAEKDLEIRGPGDMFGIKQSGIPTFALEGITDSKLIRDVRREAVEILKKSPGLDLYPALKREIKKIEEEVHLE